MHVEENALAGSPDFLQYLHFQSPVYLKNSFSSPTFNLGGRVDYGIIPGIYVWIILDY